MKLLLTGLTLLLSLQTLAATVPTSNLNFQEPMLELKKVTIRKPLPTNLIRLYIRMPSDMRMVAGYKEMRQTNDKMSL